MAKNIVEWVILCFACFSLCCALWMWYEDFYKSEERKRIKIERKKLKKLKKIAKKLAKQK